MHPSPTSHETGKLYQMTYPARDVRVRLIQSRKNQSPQTSNSEIWELELSLFQQKLSVKDRKSRNNTILSNRGDWLKLRLREAE